MRIAMLDIETFGLSPDSVVTQIAACFFELATGQIKSIHTWWPSLEEQQTRAVDLSTIMWWLEQNNAARQSLKAPQGFRDKRDNIFNDLKCLLAPRDGEEFGPTVWAKPAMFDLPILTSYFGGKKPWHYRNERDMQTIVRMYDPASLLAPEKDESQAHNAAYDAKYQCEHLHKVYKATNGFALARQRTIAA